MLYPTLDLSLPQTNVAEPRDPRQPWGSQALLWHRIFPLLHLPHSRLFPNMTEAIVGLSNDAATPALTRTVSAGSTLPHHHHLASDPPSAPFGTLLGVTHGGVEVFSCDYENMPPEKENESFENRWEGQMTGFKYQASAAPCMCMRATVRGMCLHAASREGQHGKQFLHFLALPVLRLCLLVHACLSLSSPPYWGAL